MRCTGRNSFGCHPGRDCVLQGLRDFFRAGKGAIRRPLLAPASRAGGRGLGRIDTRPPSQSSTILSAGRRRQSSPQRRSGASRPAWLIRRTSQSTSRPAHGQSPTLMSSRGVSATIGTSTPRPLSKSLATTLSTRLHAHRHAGTNSSGPWRSRRQASQPLGHFSLLPRSLPSRPRRRWGSLSS